MIAALFVERGGVYYGLPDVDPWDEERDARAYSGPFPVVAHPPCQRWGRYWSGGPSAIVRRKLGDDGGCFAAALASVRKWGGVLEHPEASHAWQSYGLIKPPFRGGWVRADAFGGWTCCVAQGHYGHAAQKMTWLYAVGAERPELVWGRCPSKVRLDLGYHSAEERRRAIRTGVCQRLSHKQRLATPPAFRDLLIRLAAPTSPHVAKRDATGNIPLMNATNPVNISQLTDDELQACWALKNLAGLFKAILPNHAEWGDYRMALQVIADLEAKAKRMPASSSSAR